MSESTDSLIRIFNYNIESQAVHMGLKMNMKETKLMFNNYLPDHENKINDVLNVSKNKYTKIVQVQIMKQISKVYGWAVMLVVDNTML